MRVWTAHADDAGHVRLVREGCAVWALILGPLWFVAARAWVPAALLFAADLAVAVVAPAPLRPWLLAALTLLVATAARDILRWSLGLRGYHLVDVVAAAGAAAAWQRLLDRRPDLLPVWR